MSTSQRLSFIQGLRGIAILLVILFHLKPDFCPSGYLGVDVFFVISGYFLIGKHLRDTNEFRPLSFLKKKGVRLLPPYLAVIILTALSSIAIFAAKDMDAGALLYKPCLLGKPNFFLDNLTGNYFSSDTRSYPQMHLWYMGVLFQCYLLFTLLFWGWSKCHCSARTRIIHLSVLGVLSFSFAFLYLTHFPYHYVSDTYYKTSARIWEFALGGFLYVLPSPEKKPETIFAAAAALGAMIVCSFLNMPHSAIGVCIGAFCGAVLIRYGKVWDTYSPLAFKPLVWLGEISFSLYLIHWPCICFSEYVAGHILSTHVSCLLFACLVPMAFLYHRYLEAPRWSVVSIPVFWAFAAISCKSITYTHGFEHYLHQKVNQQIPPYIAIEHIASPLPSDSPLYKGTDDIPPNNFGSTPNPRAVKLWNIGTDNCPINFAIIGDSHALDFALGMHQAGLKNSWHGVLLNSYVTPFWNADFRSPNETTAIGNYFTKEKAAGIMNWLKMHPELHTVFIVQYWRARFEPHKSWTGEKVEGDMVRIRAAELRDFCVQLNAIGKKVVITTDCPELSTDSPKRVLAAYLMWHDGEDYPASMSISKHSYEQTDGAFNRELDRMADEGLCIVLHREKAFFTTEKFTIYDGQNLSHRDRHHLTEKGAAYGISNSIEQISSIINGCSKE